MINRGKLYFEVRDSPGSLLALGPNAVNAAMTSTTPSSQSKPAEITLRQNMRKLWTDHVVWTRDYIVAAVSGAPDAQAASTWLVFY